MNYANQYFETLTSLLHRTAVTTLEAQSIDTQCALSQLCSISREIGLNDRQQIFCGNGASAAFASHMALDWSKNARIQSRCFSDPSLMSAVANDLGVEEMFSTPLRCYAKPKDLLVTISSSGNSLNILGGIATARELGMTVVTFSGLKSTNQSRSLGDLNFYTPAKTYGIVECIHQILLHLWLDAFMNVEEWHRDVSQDMNGKQFIE